MATVPHTYEPPTSARPRRQQTPQQQSRATFLKLAVAGAVGGVIGLVYLGSALVYLFPSNKDALGRIEKKSLTGYPFKSGVAGPLTYDFSGHGDVVGIYVVQAEGKSYGIEQTCTHLGCPVAWDDTTLRFRCPCHGSVFAINGDVVHGPAPTPLYRHDVAMSGDTVTIGGRKV